MRKQRKLAGWGIALVAMAAVISAGTVYAAGDTFTTEAVVKSALNSQEMRSVLVNLADQPETRFVRGPLTLKEAAANNAFGAPANMVFKPKSCATYLEEVVGELGDLDGWLQYGSRVSPNRLDNFIQVVVHIPTGADEALLNKIRERVNTCKTGVLTLDGRVSGDITYTERKGLELQGAKTLAFNGRTTFDVEPGSWQYDLVRRFEMPPDAQLLVDNQIECVSQANYVAQGQTLILVQEADLSLANKLTEQMHSRVSAALRS
ncbi:hypothetical protein F4553_003433 [Allocatelliglobosispora scoriae]|uniref:PknH-like extracellular domain-containing protein n=1 Tax=Allocatelliglobosispora scoriae TaxID=643052 RepID=A0A841BP57_9ACTN|nr:hypothetical protein [Allocatelliglobosispora scoriae]MBB5870054.1 hypothetical protein [Allocatelliglobosispora scoriae]